MPDNLVAGAAGLAAALGSMAVGALATRVQVLPDVIDISFIPTGAGVGSLGFALYGAVRRFGPDRIGRLTLLGTLLGGGLTAAGLAIGLLVDVLS
jgi:hypothetical protein